MEARSSSVWGHMCVGSKVALLAPTAAFRPSGSHGPATIQTRGQKSCHSTALMPANVDESS